MTEVFMFSESLCFQSSFLPIHPLCNKGEQLPAGARKRSTSQKQMRERESSRCRRPRDKSCGLWYRNTAILVYGLEGNREYWPHVLLLPSVPCSCHVSAKPKLRAREPIKVVRPGRRAGWKRVRMGLESQTEYMSTLFWIIRLIILFPQETSFTCVLGLEKTFAPHFKIER